MEQAEVRPVHSNSLEVEYFSRSLVVHISLLYNNQIFSESLIFPALEICKASSKPKTNSPRIFVATTVDRFEFDELSDRATPALTIP